MLKALGLSHLHEWEHLGIMLEIWPDAPVTNGSVEDAQHQQAHIVHPNLVDVPGCRENARELWSMATACLQVRENTAAGGAH